ncbi:MAG: ABC transporter permease [Chitinophagaceae bacterium]
MSGLLRIELFKIFRRPRTYISFVAIAAMVLIVQVALKYDGQSYLEFLMGGLKDSIEVPFGLLLNGYLVCFIILNLLLIHVPLLVAFVAGDAIAGEANMGTLRLLLTRPVSRTHFMLTKFAACAIYTLLLLLWMALLSLVLSVMLFGTNDMVIIRNDVVEQIQRNDILWRYMAAFAYAAVALITVAALSFLLSVFAENAIGPIVSTISIVIVFTILSEMQIPVYDDTVKPWLFTSHMLAWKGFFYSRSNGEGQAIAGSIENLPAILKSLAVLLTYIGLFVGSAVIIFRRKDILS